MRSVDRERGADVETAIEELQRSVQALIDGDLVLATDGGSLLAQLESARWHLSAGDRPAAQSGMQGFVDLVQGLLQASAFGWEEGGAQIDAARTILGWLRPAGR
jgi:hypothetical protein